MKTLSLALAAAISPFNAMGLILVGALLVTFYACRPIWNWLIGIYIVGGFWYFMAG